MNPINFLRFFDDEILAFIAASQTNGFYCFGRSSFAFIPLKLSLSRPERQSFSMHKARKIYYLSLILPKAR
jgi:hypothetical protein